LKDKKFESVELNTKITILKDNINKYDQLNKLFDNNNIKGLIIKQSLPMLNKFINEYLDHFSDFGFKFNVDSSFNSSIKINNKDYEFASLSNGQSMRISFSIVLAFLKLIETKNGVSTNLLVLDEILDSSLDYNGRIELLDIIKREFYNKSVFVISHNDDIINTEHFTTTLKVEKQDGFSTIQEIK
jgi:DNA repair exonuclease SbcCD ATPase subunit